MFVQDQEPYLTFQRESTDFHKDRGVGHAIRMITQGILPNGFKWPNWDDQAGPGTEERFAISGSRVRAPRRSTTSQHTSTC